MFNLLPGGGLGFSAGSAMAFGLGAMTAMQPVSRTKDGRGTARKPRLEVPDLVVYDNAYAARQDEGDVLAILSILFEVIE